MVSDWGFFGICRMLCVQAISPRRPEAWKSRGPEETEVMLKGGGGTAVDSGVRPDIQSEMPPPAPKNWIPLDPNPKVELGPVGLSGLDPTSATIARAGSFGKEEASPSLLKSFRFEFCELPGQHNRGINDLAFLPSYHDMVSTDVQPPT